MTTGQKWGFGLTIGALFIGVSVVSYLLYKEKKKDCACNGAVPKTTATTATNIAARTIPLPSNGVCPDGYMKGADGTYCKPMTSKDLGGGASYI